MLCCLRGVGICLMWCIYHAMAPILLILYQWLRIQHESPFGGSKGNHLFKLLCNVAFVSSVGIFVTAVVLAFLAGQDSFHPDNIADASAKLWLSPHATWLSSSHQNQTH